MMASVDYDAWLGRLTKTTGFQPPSYMNLKSGQQRLPCKFVLAIPPALRPEDYFSVENLFKLHKWSPSFQQALPKLYAILSSKKIDPLMLPNPRIKLKLAPQNVGKDRQKLIVKCFTDMMLGIACYEELRKPQCDFDASLPNVPAVRLERLDINLIAFVLTAAILRDIDRLLEVENIPFGRITLPGRFGYDPKEIFKVQATWASFLCALCGIEGPQNKQILPIVIQELDLPSAYCRKHLCFPFMMAMRDATRLKAVRFSLWSMKSIDDICSDERFGALLAYSILHKNSKSSIERFAVEPVPIDKESVPFMVEMSESEDPLGKLWSAISKKVPCRPETTTISLKKGTELDSCWSSSYFLDELKTPAPWTATVVHDDASSDKIIAYLPGFGLCNIDREEIPKKKRRVMKTSPSAAPKVEVTGGSGLKSLEIELFPPDQACRPELQGSAVMEILGPILGDSLQSLSVSAGDKATLETILKGFPALKTLKHSGDKIDSMEFVFGVYEAGCQVTSLDLGRQKVDSSAMDRFMERLGGDDKAMQALERLRINSSWIPKTEAVESLFCNNKTLSALHVSTKDIEPFTALLGYHGQALVDHVVVKVEDGDALNGATKKYRSVVVEVEKKK